MELYKAIREECIELNSNAGNRDELLTQIAHLAKRTTVLADVEESALLDAFRKREEIGSTGFEDGVAIPHCRIDGVTEFVVGIVTVENGMDFGAIDGGMSNLFFFVVGPEGDRNAYVRMLSSISKSMLDATLKQSVLGGSAPAQVHELFSKHTGTPTVVANAMCSFQIIVQNEALFCDILQVVSSLTDGIDVIETRGAGHYLNSLPIFSTFWTSEERLFHRIIIGVIRRELVNELARSVNVVAGGLDDTEGVLLSVQDSLFSQGKLSS